jgi:uncharacterized protein
MSFRDHVTAPGPKRLLTIDGGGIRGVIALEILDRLQSELRVARGEPELVLSDVFDYIGGTSTGAIIAAGLALGRSTEDILALYTDHGAKMFERSRWWDRVRHTYDAAPLENILKQEFGSDTTFGDEAIQTLLLLVLRNASTDSAWPLSNNPLARFNDESLPDCNLQLPLWQLVRASTAAPVYFQPESIKLGEREFVFVDGALTPFNNPAFQLFTMATLDAYGLGWPTGEDQLLLVSVGTGNSAFARPQLKPRDMHLIHNATAVPGALMGAAAWQQDMLCRAFGRCRWGVPLDLELGDLCGSAGLVDEPLFTYLRYDMPISQDMLRDIGLDHIRIRDVIAIDKVQQIPEMREVGRRVAERCVDIAHFEGFLGIPPSP